ncbi:MAG: linear amide C-N hydrolase [Spirochaetales bacterium]|nr:linear amide C-N hydrolase [Spirochaetales bacterium]
MNIMKHLLISLFVLCAISVPTSLDACSNFFFNKNGHALFAHNNDWVSGEGMIVINKRHVQKWGFQVKNDPEFMWTSRYGSISLNFEGREITGRGINEAGLVIFEAALGETQQPGGDLPFLSVAQWVQYQLDTSATVEDVIASHKVVRIWPDDMQSHFMILDKFGTVAVIEWLEGKMVVYKGDTLPIPVLVNSTYESCITQGDDPTGRFKTITDALAAYDHRAAKNSLDYVYSILKDVSDKFPPPVQTMTSVVFDLHARRLYLSTPQNRQIRYLDMKDFDFSCQSPVLVLDLNGSGSGNVRSAFIPYTTEYNSMMVRRTFDIYSSLGYIVPEEVLKEIIDFPDKTICIECDKYGHGPKWGCWHRYFKQKHQVFPGRQLWGGWRNK